ncbi:MAG TPA: hypothetical protein VFX49_08370 [Chloroflexota bacterium]|nr:hypothetical protein [Chloroflexota bacterium]
MALGIVDVIVLRRFTEWAYVALAFDKWGLAWVSHSVTIAAGLAWLALVAWSETAYRAGVAEGRLWRRFGVVTLVELAPLSLLLWELALS